MNQLPPELVCSVFELLAFAERISATHICKRWRQIGLGHGRLWSRIRCRDAGVLDTLLTRTRRVSVDVQVTDISASNCDDIVDLIGAHLDHIRLLALDAGDSKLDLAHVTAVHHALARAAPLLEVVDIQLFDHPFPKNIATEIHDAHVFRATYPVPADSFLHQAPRLRQLSFRTITLPDAAADAFSSITTLELDTIYLSAANLSALVSLPSLRSLHLEVVECELPRTPTPATFKLDELWIYGPYGTPWDAPVDPVLRYLGFPHIRHFASDWHALWPAMVSAPRSLPHTLLIERWEVDRERGVVDSEAWRLLDAAGFVTDLLGVRTCQYLGVPDRQLMLAGLRELVILYAELRMADSLAIDFRALARLCVRVSGEDCARSDWGELSAVPAPQLRTLELWGGIERTTVSMRAADVLGFVRDFFLLDPRGPPELVLRDVDITHSAEEWAQLEAVVTGIRYPGGPAPQSFVAELKSSWHAAVQQ